MRGGLQRLGILRESGHEHFNGSVVIPVFDRAGGGRDVRPHDQRQASGRDWLLHLRKSRPGMIPAYFFAVALYLAQRLFCALAIRALASSERWRFLRPLALKPLDVRRRSTLLDKTVRALFSAASSASIPEII